MSNHNDAAHDRLKRSWSFILGTREGRAVVRDLLAMCHYGLSPFTGDNDKTNFISGKQKVGEGIMEMINAADPIAYFTMTKEAKEEQDHDRTSNPDRSDDDPRSNAAIYDGLTASGVVTSPGSSG